MDGIFYSISKNESYRIDCVKLLMCIGVLFLHAYSKAFVDDPAVTARFAEGLTNFISNILSDCAVPSFIFISAVLLYSKQFSWKQNVKKKIRSLLIPYVIFNTLWILISIVKFHFLGGNNSAETDYTYFGLIQWLDAYFGLYGEFTPALTVLWYVRDLFILNLLAPFIKIIVDKLPRLIFVLLLIIWLSGVKIFILHTYAVVFFFFGYYTIKYNLRMNMIDKIKPVPFFIFYVLLAGLDFYFSKQIIIHRCFVVMSVLFWFKVSNYMVPMNKLFRIAVPVTFFIYLTHRFIYLGVNFLYRDTAISYIAIYFIKPLAALVIGIVFYYLMKRYTPYLLSILTGGRNKKK